MSDALFPLPGWTARFSEKGAYRYELTRRWANGPTVTFIMLNPSKADAYQDDPTVRRCQGFARTWGMGALYVVNLYALRSTDPRALWEVEDPVGPENDDAIHDAVVRSRAAVVAWGANARRERAAAVLELIRGIGRVPLCLGRTKAAGAPRHPLYVRGDVRPTPYET